MAVTASAKALLIDVTRCVGCRACSAMCKEIHGFDGDVEQDKDLGPESYTVVVERGPERFVRKLCMHCVDPSCASACPVSALHKTAEGPVAYDASRCLGCRYCMVACPFGVPRYEWDNPIPRVRKCDMCVDRQAQGLQTACAEACGFEATVFGKRADLIAEAHRRIAESPGSYHPEVYGETTVGGTSVLILSPVPFDKLGMRTDLGTTPFPELTWRALEKIPGVVTVGGAFLSAVWWITHRREDVAAAADAEAGTKPPAQAEGGQR